MTSKAVVHIGRRRRRARARFIMMEIVFIEDQRDPGEASFRQICWFVAKLGQEEVYGQ